MRRVTRAPQVKKTPSKMTYRGYTIHTEEQKILILNPDGSLLGNAHDLAHAKRIIALEIDKRTSPSSLR
jgi:hypothetical protein